MKIKVIELRRLISEVIERTPAKQILSFIMLGRESGVDVNDAFKAVQVLRKSGLRKDDIRQLEFMIDLANQGLGDDEDVNDARMILKPLETSKEKGSINQSRMPGLSKKQF